MCAFICYLLFLFSLAPLCFEYLHIKLFMIQFSASCMRRHVFFTFWLNCKVDVEQFMKNLCRFFRISFSFACWLCGSSHPESGAHFDQLATSLWNAFMPVRSFLFCENIYLWLNSKLIVKSLCEMIFIWNGTWCVGACMCEQKKKTENLSHLLLMAKWAESGANVTNWKWLQVRECVRKRERDYESKTDFTDYDGAA